MPPCSLLLVHIPLCLGGHPFLHENLVLWLSRVGMLSGDAFARDQQAQHPAVDVETLVIRPGPEFLLILVLIRRCAFPFLSF